MLIPISSDEGSSRSWALIEMQGEVERKDGGTLEEAFDVGTLSVSSSVSREGCAPGRGAGLAAAARRQVAAAGTGASGAEPSRLHGLQGAVMLTIGYHQLEGKRMELKKPFAVLDRVADAEGHSTEYKVGRGAGAEPSTCPGRQCKLAVSGDSLITCVCVTSATASPPLPQVIGVVREKILFKARPRALITKPELK